MPLGRKGVVLFTPKLSQNPNMSAVSGDVGGLEAQPISKASFQGSMAVVWESEQRVGVKGSAQIMASKDELARRESESLPLGEDAQREGMDGKQHESGPEIKPVRMLNLLYAHKALEVSGIKQDIPRVCFIETQTKQTPCPNRDELDLQAHISTRTRRPESSRGTSYRLDLPLGGGGARKL